MRYDRDQVRDLLHGRKEYECCDLFEFVLADGSIYRYAEYDRDVIYDSKVWYSGPFIFSRDQVRVTGEPSVDTLTVLVSAEPGGGFGDMHFHNAFMNGTINQGSVSLYQVFFDGGAVIGGFKMFEGRPEVSAAGGLQVKLLVKSVTQGLAMQIPVRTFAPQRAYITDDEGKVVVSENDTNTMMIPNKPSAKVLVRS